MILFRVATFLVLVMVSVITTTGVYAQDTGAALHVIDPLRGSEVSIHSGPGIAYTEHAVITSSLTLPITGRNNFVPTQACLYHWESDRDMWLRVQFNEIEGWVWRCHPSIEIIGDITAIPVVEPAFAVLTKDARYPLIDDTNVPQGDFAVASAVRYAAAVMREAPVLDAAIIGTIPFTDFVFIIGRTERAGWVKAAYGDQVGWIASHLLGMSRDWQEFVPIISQES